MMKDNTKHFTVREVAIDLDTSERLTRRLILTGGLPAIRLGRLLRIPKAEFEAWKRERRVTPNELR